MRFDYNETGPNRPRIYDVTLQDLVIAKTVVGRGLKRIENPDNWVQGTYQTRLKRKLFSEEGILKIVPTSFCAVGAMSYNSSTFCSYEYLVRDYFRLAGCPDIEGMNDGWSCRSGLYIRKVHHAEIVDIFKKVISLIDKDIDQKQQAMEEEKLELLLPQLDAVKEALEREDDRELELV